MGEQISCQHILISCFNCTPHGNLVQLMPPPNHCICDQYLFFSDILIPSLGWIRTSVTRFGDISPLWQNILLLSQNILLLWLNLEGLFSIWQNFELSWAKVLCYWANFYCCKWPNIKQLPSHLVTLNFELKCKREVTHLTVGQFIQSLSKDLEHWAEVVAQLVERSLPTPEVCSLNPVIGKTSTVNSVVEKTKLKKKRDLEWLIFLKKRPELAQFKSFDHFLQSNILQPCS